MNENEKLGVELAELLRTPRQSLPQDLELSAWIDARLGLHTPTIEDALKVSQPHSGHPIEHHWIGLRPEVLQTGYLEYAHCRDVLLERNPQFQEDLWVDLGAAYGRLGVVLGLSKPRIRFRGIECVPERVEAGRRAYEKLGIDGAQLELADLNKLAEFAPDERVFFLYDFGPRPQVEALLARLRDHSRSKPFALVARGRGSQHWIDRGHPWLSQVQPCHRLEHSTIYFS